MRPSIKFIIKEYINVHVLLPFFDFQTCGLEYSSSSKFITHNLTSLNLNTFTMN